MCIRAALNLATLPRQTVFTTLFLNSYFYILNTLIQFVHIYFIDNCICMFLDSFLIFKNYVNYTIHAFI